MQAPASQGRSLRISRRAARTPASRRASNWPEKKPSIIGQEHSAAVSHSPVRLQPVSRIQACSATPASTRPIPVKSAKLHQ